jgi:hypothetical protein
VQTRQLSFEMPAVDVQVGLWLRPYTPPLSLPNALIRTVRTGRGELAVDWVVGITDARVAFQLLFCRIVLPDLVRLVHIDCNRFNRRCCTASASSPAAVNRLIPSMHTVIPMLDVEPLGSLAECNRHQRGHQNA